MTAKAIGAVKRGSLVSPCCCGASCFLTMPTLLIDGTTTPYANIGAATAAIAAQTAGCLIERTVLSAGQTQTAFTASYAGTLNTSISIDGSDDGGGNYIENADLLGVITISAAGTISVTYSLTGTTLLSSRFVGISIVDEGGVTVSQDSSVDGPFSVYADGTFNLPVPSAGTYQVFMQFSKVSSLGENSATFTGSIAGISGTCGVRAAYGGTPDYVICT